MTLEHDQLELARFGAEPGMPLLLFHEGLGSLSMWRDFPEKLAKASGREVIVWSRRGYGASGSFDAPYDLDFMHREADTAARVMADLGFAQAHVFGHSDGGSIAMLLAARHPGRVASLILEAPHVMVEPVCISAIKAVEAGSAALVSRLGRYHRDAAAVFRQWFAIWTDPRFPAWTIEAEIESVTCPVLLIQGDDDEYGTCEQLDRIQARVPQARQLRLAACGHSPHRDQQDAVLAAASVFLNELGDA
ncbi:MAG: alpha/beta hydrolase [Novosphingobium sp.]|jgi:pimeloyl-ACP methyl ester carboxylesterase|uniref:alpha/beta fold hydrolase n=1 Tax=Novosphingobium sp. TaxID=1874826 RepID=UPI00301A9AAB